MAGQTIVNFDGLSPEAAEKLAAGQVEAVKVKINAIAEQVKGMSPENAIRFESIIDRIGAGSGNCGIGCA